VSAQDAMRRLDELAAELDQLSTALTEVERNLEPVEAEYAQHIDDYELGLYTRSIDDPDFKLPSEALRLKLAVRDMDPGLYGRRNALVSSRDRIEKRMRAIKTQVDAQRSILSAEKTVLEGAR